jgi:hypothetical protein
MKKLMLALLAVTMLAGCYPADTHLRHDDQSRSSGEAGSTPY